ncbi:MAG: hypothetical protein WCL61_00925 [bacterium]
MKKSVLDNEMSTSFIAILCLLVIFPLACFLLVTVINIIIPLVTRHPSYPMKDVVCGAVAVYMALFAWGMARAIDHY